LYYIAAAAAAGDIPILPLFVTIFRRWV